MNRGSHLWACLVGECCCWTVWMVEIVLVTFCLCAVCGYHVDARGQPQVLFLRRHSSSSVFLIQGLLLVRKSRKEAMLVSLWAQEISLTFPPKIWNDKRMTPYLTFYMGSKDQTQVLRLRWQTLHWLSYLYKLCLFILLMKAWWKTVACPVEHFTYNIFSTFLFSVLFTNKNREVEHRESSKMYVLAFSVYVFSPINW